MHDRMRARTPLIGAVAGAGAALAFTALHHLVISNIWSSIGAMLAAGAACGACLTWSYARLFTTPSVATWAGYNAAYVVILAGLGLASVLMFEPVTTIPVLLASNKPPVPLIQKALPLTVACIAIATLALWLSWGRTIGDALALLLTSALLVLVLGLNVSIIGLVRLTNGAPYIVTEQFGLTLFLAVVFGLIVAIIDRRRFRTAA